LDSRNQDRTMDFKQESIQTIISAALLEDIGAEDHSSKASIPDSKTAEANLIFKDNGVVAGICLAEEILQKVDANLMVEKLV